MNIKIKILSIFSIIVLITSFIIPEDVILKRLIEQFNNYYSKYSVKKVFVHTDKDNYVANESIWFKVYVLDSENHKLDTLCTNVYVELINSENKIEQVKLLKISKGTAIGDFQIPDSVIAGDYQIRAYVESMMNFNTKLFFTKTIKIFNPNNSLISSELYQKAKKNIRKNNFYAVNFYPQNKNFINNIETTRTFICTDYQNNGVKIGGYIQDKHRKKITEIKCNEFGIGSYTFTPEINNKYKCVVFGSKNKKKKYNLPEIKERGYELTINAKEKNTIQINIESNLPSTNDKQFKTIYLIGQIRGKIYYSYAGIIENNKLSLSIPKNKFPTGIVQFTLFNGKGNYELERLLFINHSDNFKISTNIKNNKKTIELLIKTTDYKNQNISANLSVSVINLNEKINSENIISYTLLSSEITEKPSNFLFWNKNKLQHIQIINQLLECNKSITNDWNMILNQKKDTLMYKEKKGITISGRVTKKILDLSAKKAKVTMTILKGYNDTYTTNTDNKGNYKFEDLFYSDTLDVLLEVVNKREKDNLLIYADSYDTIPITFFPTFTSNFSKYKYKNIKRKNKKKREKNTSSIHRSADQIIYFDEINTSTGQNVLDIISSRVPGLTQNGNAINVRNSGLSNLSDEPLYLIDDIPVDASAVSNLNPNDVERVEILKSKANTTIYGMRGINGVIAIYTKQGYHIVSGWLKSKQLGYYHANTFIYNKLDITYPNNFHPTIFWKPVLITDSLAYAKFSFTIPENISSFKIIIQGISENGRTGYLEKIIRL